MLDLSYFQNQYYGANSQTFTTGGSWQTWVKPRGAKYVNIFCMGAGSGGGAGFISGSTPRCGGGGGAGGGLVRATFQASLLPDILYVQCGAGGSGGLTTSDGVQAGSGGSGNRSFVTLIPSVASAANIIVTSGAVAAVGGPGGFNVNGTQAAGETIATTANAIFLNLGNFTAIAGQNGPASSTANAAGATISQINSPGGSGASRAGFAGGPITGSGPVPTLTNALNQPGPNGIILYKPILAFTGGAGGAFSSITNIGFNGGNASYGSGGGGGGAGTTAGAGNGGRGGDGLIIITTSF
jgi:hypothetical protein